MVIVRDLRISLAPKTARERGEETTAERGVSARQETAWVASIFPKGERGISRSP